VASAENPRFIETLPRKGYRLIAPIVKYLHLSEKHLHAVVNPLDQLQISSVKETN
jgi:DNA-binding winged helix-turn-helix (wHTH) protein